MVSELRLTRWNKTAPPDVPTLRHVLQLEGHSVLEWTDAPGTVYPVHTHPFAQAHVVLAGTLRIGLPETGEEITLRQGDRLDIPPETPHWEDVSPGQATTYLAGSCTPHNHADLNWDPAKSSRHAR